MLMQLRFLLPYHLVRLPIVLSRRSCSLSLSHYLSPLSHSLSFFLSLCVSMSLCLSVCLSLSVFVSLCLSLSLSFFSFFLSSCMCVYVSICLSLSVPLCLSLYVCLPLSFTISASIPVFV